MKKNLMLIVKSSTNLMKVLSMVILIPLLFACTSQVTKSTQQNSPFNAEVKRVVFIGDSITYAGDYINFVEAYLRIKYPENEIEFINVGLPSETVSGLSEENHAQGRFPRPDLFSRLDRIIDKVKPDLAFTNYGMNDGIFLPFNQARFARYKAGVHRLHKTLADAGIEQVHITSPIFDTQKGVAYAEVLHLYADWLFAQKGKKNWQVIDGHWPMQHYLDEKRKVNTEFSLAHDGVHPNALGHGIIANQVLRYLGESIDTRLEPGNELLLSLPNGDLVLQQIRRSQNIMKDAWLSHIGHNRPNMKQGLPLKQARQEVLAIYKTKP